MGGYYVHLLHLLLIPKDVPAAGLHPLIHGGGRGVNDEAGGSPSAQDLKGLPPRGWRSPFSSWRSFFSNVL